MIWRYYNTGAVGCNDAAHGTGRNWMVIFERRAIVLSERVDIRCASDVLSENKSRARAKCL